MCARWTKKIHNRAFFGSSLEREGHYSDRQFPLLNSYFEEPVTWWVEITEYYGFDKQRAKTIALAALFSGRYVPFEGADILPRVRGLLGGFPGSYAKSADD